MIIILIIEFLFNQHFLGLPLRLLLFCGIISYYAIQKRRLYLHKLVWFTIVFYFMFLLIRIMNGDFGFVDFFKEFVSSTLGLIAFSYIVESRSLNIEKFTSRYILLFTFNATVVSAQFFGFEWSRILPEFLSADYTYLGDGRYSYADKIDGMSLPTGIMDFTVSTGYFHLSFLPFIVSQNRHKLSLLFLWVITALFLGQRSVALIGLVFLFIKNRRFVILFAPFLLFWPLIEFFLDDVGLLSYKFRGGSAIVKDEDRLELVLFALNHVQENPWLGGVKKYVLLFGDGANIAHNIFLNSLIYSGYTGLLTLLTYLAVVGVFIKDSYKSTFVQAGLLLFFNSFFHNAGIITGDFVLIIFIVAGLWTSPRRYQY
jgi:hypothetical protein